MTGVRRTRRRTARLRVPALAVGLPVVTAVMALNALANLLNAMANVVGSFRTVNRNNNTSSTTLSMNVSRTLVGATFNVLAS